MNYSASTSIVTSASQEKVWDALTKPEIVKQYFFGTDMVTDWVAGSPIFFRGQWEGKKYEDKGVVLSFNPMESLSYTYLSSMGGQEDTPENYQTLIFTLKEDSGSTTLTISQSNAPTQEAADHSLSSWKIVLEGLKKIVETGN